MDKDLDNNYLSLLNIINNVVVFLFNDTKLFCKELYTDKKGGEKSITNID